MRIIDSHTEGEPTRVIVEGAPDLGSGPLTERVTRLSEEFDTVRQQIILEPRGSDAMVGALLCPPTRNDCATGVIFFNNTGYLGMCGHGAMGVAVTLAYLGKAPIGELKLETPVGVVSVDLISENEVRVENVPSYCFKEAVDLEVEGLGRVEGDVAWGGNWFFLVNGSPCEISLSNQGQLSDAAHRIMSALSEQGVTGDQGQVIDHVEFFDAPSSSEFDSRNFVMCPGGAYDRSPCGTGTSAKLACLAHKGLLAPGETWVQESIIGSRFKCSYQLNGGGKIIPTIAGRAFICGETQVIAQDGDPFKFGIQIDGDHAR